VAEFAEVMRQWVRVRKATASSTEENVLSVYPLEEYDDALIADIEKNVMQWAAEHPEPVYPTWVEWLVDSGVFPQKMSTIPSVAFNTIRDSLSVEIPADIAEKLGVKPKETDH